MLGRQALGQHRVQDDRLDAVVAQLLDARPVGEAVHAAAQVVHARDVEGAVADRDLVEAVGREVLPDTVERAVGGQVQQRPGQADLRLRRLGHDAGGRGVPRLRRGCRSASTTPSTAGRPRSVWRSCARPACMPARTREPAIARPAPASSA